MFALFFCQRTQKWSKEALGWVSKITMVMENSFEGCSISRDKGQLGIELDYLQLVWGHGDVLQYTRFRKKYFEQR